MKRTTLYLTRDIDGTLVLHEELPSTDGLGFWASPGEMQDVEPHTLLHNLLHPYCEAVRNQKPLAIEVQTDWSAVNRLLRKPV